MGNVNIVGPSPSESARHYADVYQNVFAPINDTIARKTAAERDEEEQRQRQVDALARIDARVQAETKAKQEQDGILRREMLKKYSGAKVDQMTDDEVNQTLAILGPHVDDLDAAKDSGIDATAYDTTGNGITGDGMNWRGLSTDVQTSKRLPDLMKTADKYGVPTDGYRYSSGAYDADSLSAAIEQKRGEIAAEKTAAAKGGKGGSSGADDGGKTSDAYYAIGKELADASINPEEIDAQRREDALAAISQPATTDADGNVYLPTTSSDVTVGDLVLARQAALAKQQQMKAQQAAAVDDQYLATLKPLIEQAQQDAAISDDAAKKDMDIANKRTKAIDALPGLAKEYQARMQHRASLGVPMTTADKRSLGNSDIFGDEAATSQASPSAPASSPKETATPSNSKQAIIDDVKALVKSGALTADQAKQVLQQAGIQTK